MGIARVLEVEPFPRVPSVVIPRLAKRAEGPPATLSITTHGQKRN
jgi:hypothetical protein